MCFIRSLQYYFLFKWNHRLKTTVDLPILFPLSSLNLPLESIIYFFCNALHPQHIFFVFLHIVALQQELQQWISNVKRFELWEGLPQRQDTKKMFSVTVSVCFCCCLFVCLSGYKLANRKKNLSTQLLPYLMELLIFLEGGFMSVARLLRRLCLLKTCVFTGHTYIAYKQDSPPPTQF